MALADECEVHTFCHVTGGGLAGNLARVIPTGLVAELSRGTWVPGPIFRLIQNVGKVPQAEMEKTFNMGGGHGGGGGPRGPGPGLGHAYRPAH